MCQCIVSGTVCEIDIDECENNRCRNGAACVDGQGEYFCECRAGYEGPLCQFVSNPVGENTSESAGPSGRVAWVANLEECFWLGGLLGSTMSIYK